jgi:hypothetical protein
MCGEVELTVVKTMVDTYGLKCGDWIGGEIVERVREILIDRRGRGLGK